MAYMNQETADPTMHIAIPGLPTHVTIPEDTEPEAAATVARLLHQAFARNPHLNDGGSNRADIEIEGLPHPISLPVNTPVETVHEIARHLHQSFAEGNVAEYHLKREDEPITDRIINAAESIKAMRESPSVFRAIAKRFAPPMRRMASNISTAVRTAATPRS